MPSMLIVDDDWNADLPMPLYTFLETYDFSGKTIIPFVTHCPGILSKGGQTCECKAKNENCH